MIIFFIPLQYHTESENKFTEHRNAQEKEDVLLRQTRRVVLTLRDVLLHNVAVLPPELAPIRIAVMFLLLAFRIRFPSSNKELVADSWTFLRHKNVNQSVHPVHHIFAWLDVILMKSKILYMTSHVVHWYRTRHCFLRRLPGQHLARSNHRRKKWFGGFCPPDTYLKTTSLNTSSFMIIPQHIHTQ